METLISILQRACSQLEDGWLYLPENEVWDMNTLGVIVDVLENGEADDEKSLLAIEEGLMPTLDSATIESIATVAKHLEYDLSDDLLLESFLYYFEYDAFLPHPGFRPPSPEVAQKKMDKEFFDCLGPERLDVQCKSESCQRGAVTGSVF